MTRALELAKKANGKTFPNPLVGCVIVRDGKIIAEGYHKRAGMPHAEIEALDNAKKSTIGADLYVTLEPCSHYGRTSPCVDRIVESRIKNVYAAMKDPNPLVSGKGFKFLKENGIKVTTGICQKEAEELNIIYTEYITRKK